MFAGYRIPTAERKEGTQCRRGDSSRSNTGIRAAKSSQTTRLLFSERRGDSRGRTRGKVAKLRSLHQVGITIAFGKAARDTSVSRNSRGCTMPSAYDSPAQRDYRKFAYDFISRVTRKRNGREVRKGRRVRHAPITYGSP